MNDIDTTPRPRGRIPNDPEWAAIVAKAERTLPADGDLNENENMVDDWRSGHRYHGCVIHPKDHKRATGSVWQCRFYLAGAQRVLGRGTLYQCARLYDAALVKYADFRSNRTVAFNFSESEAKHDQGHADFVLYFGAIEDYFKPRGELLDTATNKQEHARLRVLDRQHRTRTFSGQVQTQLDALTAQVSALAKNFDTLDTRIAQLDGRIAMLCSKFGLHTRTESAELLAESKLHQIPGQLPGVTTDLHPYRYECCPVGYPGTPGEPGDRSLGPVGESGPGCPDCA